MTRGSLSRAPSPSGPATRLLRSKADEARRPTGTAAALCLGLALLAGRDAAADGLAVDPADPRFADRPDLVARLSATPHGYFRFVNAAFAAETCRLFADVAASHARGQPARRRARRAVRGHEPRPRPHRLRRLHAGQAGHRPRPLRRLAPPRGPREGLEQPRSSASWTSSSGATARGSAATAGRCARRSWSPASAPASSGTTLPRCVRRTRSSTRLPCRTTRSPTASRGSPSSSRFGRELPGGLLPA